MADPDEASIEQVADCLLSALTEKGHLWLFLDYDGTLADFAPNPDIVLPDPQLIGLLGRLARLPRRLRVVILSGRRLSHIETLLPLPGILLAGTYGLEYRNLEGETFYRLDFETNRPVLDQIQPEWKKLTSGKAGFYLEDKGWSLALHARYAGEEDAQVVLNAARQYALSAPGRESFHLFGGDRFLELAPTMADKGQSVTILLDQLDWPGAGLFYFGDDDKDEQAFDVVRNHGGTPVLVAPRPRRSRAELRLPSPFHVRGVLERIADRLEEKPA